MSSLCLIFGRWLSFLFQWENTGHLAGNASTSLSITCRLSTPTSASVLISLPPVVETASLQGESNPLTSTQFHHSLRLLWDPTPQRVPSPMSLAPPSVLALALQLTNIFKSLNQRTLKAFFNPMSSSKYSPMSPFPLESLHLLPLPPLFPFIPQVTAVWLLSPLLHRQCSCQDCWRPSYGVFLVLVLLVFSEASDIVDSSENSLPTWFLQCCDICHNSFFCCWPLPC